MYKDPERERDYKREWREANRDKQRGYERAWRARNREKSNASSARWRAENPEAQAAAVKRWRKENPEAYKALRKRYLERRRQDPERYQAWLDEQRMSYRLRKERNGKGLEVARQYHNAKGAYKPLTDVHAAMRAERLDAAPFFAWLDLWQKQRKDERMSENGRTATAAAASLEELCKLAGFNVKRLSESRLKGAIRLDIVEAFLDIVDGPQVWELYPTKEQHD